MKQYLFVTRQLVSREVKRKYTRSKLGILWSVLNPLLSMAVLSMIFSSMFRRSIENYPVYYLTGFLIWNMFTISTTTAMTALVDNKPLLIKVRLPMLIFPAARVLTALVNLFYSLIAYGIMLLVFQIRPSVSMLFFPLVLFFLFLFSLGMSNVLAVIYVFFGDVKHLYSVVITLWMYCSAIFYPVDTVAPFLKTIILLNPVYGFIACARECMLYQTIPGIGAWIWIGSWGLEIWILGYLLYEKMRNRIMQNI